MPRTKGRLRTCTEPGCNNRFRSNRTEELCKPHKESRSYNKESIESWFMDSANTVLIVSKKGLPVIYSVPDRDWVIVTLEAQQDYNGRSDNPLDFHILVRSSHTPAYPVSLHSFLDKYDIVINETPQELITATELKLNFLMTCQANEDYCAIPKALPVMAIRAPVSGTLLTSWGSLLPFTKTKSFILRYKENDFAVIDPAVFALTYQSKK